MLFQIKICRLRQKRVLRMRVWNETMIANIEIYEVMKRLVKKNINPDK